MTTTFIQFTRINGLSNRRRYPIIGKIRLGIEAPRDVPIFRQELLQNPPPDKAGAGPAPALLK